MSLSKDIQISLIKKIGNANLLLKINEYKKMRLKVTQLGIKQYKSIQSVLGREVMNLGISKLNFSNPKETCFRVLGFGHLLTEFLVAPVISYSDTERYKVIKLGTLANFIVGIYDHLIDQENANRKFLLPRWILKGIISYNLGSLIDIFVKFSPASSKLLIKLVIYYIKVLKNLEKVEKNLLLSDFLKKLIIYMYDIENKTLFNDKSLVTDYDLKLKSSLPFVVMGLSAWLIRKKSNQKLYGWHLNWLNRFGDFFGWIDDFMDYREDLLKGQPNRIRNVVRQQLKSEENLHQLFHSIVKQGRQILVEWNQHIVEPKKIPIFIKNAFSTCLISWLGGTNILSS